MLTNLGIKGRVLLLTLVPSGVFAGLLGAWFSYSQLNDLQQQLLQRGELILNQLSLAGAQSLDSDRSEQLIRIAQDAIELKDVRSIRIVAAPDRVIVHNGPSMRKQDFSAITKLTTFSTDASSQLILPLYPRSSNSANGALEDEAGSDWLDQLGIVASREFVRRLPQRFYYDFNDSYWFNDYRSFSFTPQSHYQYSLG